MLLTFSANGTTAKDFGLYELIYSDYEKCDILRVKSRGKLELERYNVNFWNLKMSQKLSNMSETRMHYHGKQKICIKRHGHLRSWFDLIPLFLKFS